MIKQYFRIFYRNIKRNKSSFIINLIGLSTGLACTFLIYLWVNDELHVDKFHDNDKRLYQTSIFWPATSDSRGGRNFSMPGQLAEDLINEFPGIEYSIDVVQQTILGNNTLSHDGNDIKGVPLYSHKDFFNVFSFDLIAGDKGQVLSDKYSIAISESLAMKLFGDTKDVVGKTIKFNHDRQFTVSGIFKDVPKNSSIQFDFVLSSDWIKEQYAYMYSYNTNNVYIYVVLKEGVDINEFNKKIANFLLVKNRDYYDNIAILELVSFSDQYLYDDDSNTGGRIVYVRLFSIIAFFILIIACINFMNLSTAQSFKKIKEFGIKKTIGAGRKYLITQYISDTMILTFLSVIIAFFLVLLVLPRFNDITGKQLHLTLNSDMSLMFLGITVFTGLLAGSYPAFYLSGFNPAQVLKGKLNNLFGEQWIRKGLVIFQFTLSIILIVGVLVIYKQINYIQTKNLGYNRDHIIYFDREGVAEINLDQLISELERIPGVTYASSAETKMVADCFYSGIDWEGKTESQDRSFIYRNVNYNMIELLGMEIKEGRSFSRDFGSDQTKTILNEAAIKYMGFEDPIGKKVRFWGRDREIIGVVKDFQFKSLHEEVEPVIFNVIPEESNFIYTKLEAGIEKETIERIQKFYKKYNPGFPLNFKFMDDDYQKLYESEIRIGVLSRYFGGIAIIISCLGLFGLTAYTAQRRTREIGVRKVHGSSELGIIYLLSGEFSLLVIVAIALALPVSYMITNHWLGSFAYKIDLHPWYFLGSGLIALAIAWLTVGMHAVKAANINPAQCLKNE